MPNRGVEERLQAMATWREHFPWIDHQAKKQWNADVYEAQHQLADQLATDILRSHRFATFGELFPTMPDDFMPECLDVEERYRAGFTLLGVTTMADLAPIQVCELLDLRTVTNRGGHSILRALIFANLANATESLLPNDCASELNAPSESAHERGGVAARKSVPPQLAEDMALLASWQWLIGRQDSPLLLSVDGAPEMIRAARERLVSMPASAVLAVAKNLAQILAAAIVSLGEREPVILKERSFADQPRTLEQLAETFGVTRERVRQIQRNAHQALQELTISGHIAEIVDLLRHRTQIPTPIARLIADYPVLAEEVEPVSQPVWRVLDVLDNSYEIHDGWCASPTIAAAQEATRKRLEELANPQGVVPIAQVWLGQCEDEGRPAWLRDWITYLGYTLREDYVLMDTKSLESYAAALLSIAGNPLDVEELHEQIGRGGRRTLLNGLHASEQITRVGPQTFALAEWQLPEYTSIRDEIAKILQESGGKEQIDVIIDSITERFSVAPNSVYAYAAAPPFKLEDRVVSVRGDEDQPKKRNPAEVAGYYRRGDQWLMRDSVNSDYLRGSGRLCSTALASIVGLDYGERAIWDSPYGEQAFYYSSSQPSLGSIRLTLQALGLQEGDEFFLVFGPGETCTIEPLPPLPDTALARALRAVGADASLQGWDAFAALAAAVECRPEPREVIAAYDQRGESDIAEVIRAGTLG